MAAKGDIPHDLAVAVSNHTGFPWWNGNAYAEHIGLPQRIGELREVTGMAVDDIADVIEALRQEGNYAMADRLRTIAGRLARAHAMPEPEQGSPLRSTWRWIARGWK